MTLNTKFLTKEQITEFLQNYLSQFEGYRFINEKGIKTAIFQTTTPNQLLKAINSKISIALNDYIENTLQDNCKSYDRNLIFFESDEKESLLILRWM